MHALLALVLCTDLENTLRENAVVLAVRVRVDLNDVVVSRREVRRDIPLEVRAIERNLRDRGKGWRWLRFGTREWTMRSCMHG